MNYLSISCALVLVASYTYIMVQMTNSACLHSSASVHLRDHPYHMVVENSTERGIPFFLKLKRHGNSLLGRSNMERIISEAKFSEIMVLSVGVLIVSHRDDDSIPRLKNEFKGGGSYRFDFPFKNPPSATPPLIVDVGGNLGFATIAFAMFHEDAQIVTFEPNPFTYIYLCWNLFLNQIHVLDEKELMYHSVPGVFPVFGGLGGGDEYVVKIPMPNDFPEKSQNNIAGGRSPFSTIEDADNQVPIYSLSLFMEKYNLVTRALDVVKLDCECCEYPLVSSNKELFSDQTLVKRIVGELHPFGKCRDYFNLTSSVQDDVLAALEKRGCGLSGDAIHDGNIGSVDIPHLCCPAFCPDE